MPFFHLSTLALLLLASFAPAQEPAPTTTPAVESVASAEKLPSVQPQEPVEGSEQAGVVKVPAQNSAEKAPAQDGAAEDSAPEPLLEIPRGFQSTADPALATDLLLEIADAQFHAKNPTLVDGIRLNLYLKERENGQASEIGFGLQYLVHPREIIGLEIEDLERGTSVQKGFDGSNYWLIEEDKEKQILSGHEFGKDRESIDEAMDLCSDLMLMLDFRQLEKRNMPRAVLRHEDGRRILVGDLRRQEGSKWRYHLWIAAGSLQPHRLEMAREVEVEVLHAPADATADLDTAEQAVDPSVDSENTGNDSAMESSSEPILKKVVEYQRFELLHYDAFDGRFIPQWIELFHTPFPGDTDLPARILQIRKFSWMSN
jgi:hypothetical protein